ncbi:MAG: glycosyltransferase family 39 protein [Deltaproteobacteria bacterium]|nr:glycosyltransferase family 39 protein [Deltaproteobacteria bacterium]
MPTRLLAASIVRDHDLDLDELPGVDVTDPPYFLKSSGGHVYSRFPPGRAFLLVPVYALADALGVPVLTDEDARRALARWLGALACAATVTIIYVTLARLGPRRRALATAVVAGFGTAVWPVAAQDVWQHTFGLPLVAWCVAILERAWRDERPRLGWIGVPLGMLVLIRTPSTLFAGALALAALIRDRRALGWVVLGAAPAMAALLAYNGAIFHHPLGAYADAAARVSPWAWPPRGSRAAGEPVARPLPLFAGRGAGAPRPRPRRRPRDLRAARLLRARVRGTARGPRGERFLRGGLPDRRDLARWLDVGTALPARERAAGHDAGVVRLRTDRRATLGAHPRGARGGVLDRRQRRPLLSRLDELVREPRRRLLPEPAVELARQPRRGAGVGPRPRQRVPAPARDRAALRSGAHRAHLPRARRGGVAPARLAQASLAVAGPCRRRRGGDRDPGGGARDALAHRAAAALGATRRGATAGVGGPRRRRRAHPRPRRRAHRRHRRAPVRLARARRTARPRPPPVRPLARTDVARDHARAPARHRVGRPPGRGDPRPPDADPRPAATVTTRRGAVGVGECRV